MPRGRPVAPVELSEEAEAELTRISRSRSLPSSLVQRAQIVLACAVGASNTAVAARLGVGAATVGRWRRRYRERGLEGLHDELRPGRPRTYDDERVATVINDALQTKPPARTHWSVRAMASHSGISKSTVQRWFKLFGLQPHRHQYFKLSTDPFFIEKVRDIVGLYLDPPDHAVVLCVDEKSQIQALQRSQPVLPMGLGYVEGVTHDYGRHGTTTLFAALEVATGTVITDCKTRHRHQEFLGFLRRIDANVPADLDVHLIVDNYVTHKHARVKGVAGEAPAVSRALHADLCLLDQPGGTMVRHHHRAGHPPGLVPQRAGSGPVHQSLRRAVQRQGLALRLDRHRPIDPRQGRETCILYFRDVTLVSCP